MEKLIVYKYRNNKYMFKGNDLYAEDIFGNWEFSFTVEVPECGIENQLKKIGAKILVCRELTIEDLLD